MDIQNIELSKLKPYGKNAKKHPKKQIEQVAASIKEFGFKQPIVTDKDMVLIVGHGRLEAAKLLGLKEVPVLVADLTEEQAKAYRLADNKLNESYWDMELAAKDLKGLDSRLLELTGFDLDLGTDYDMSLLDEYVDKEDLDAMKGNVRRAIQIDFNPGDYERAVEISKRARGENVYLGGVFLDALTALYEES